MKSSITKPIDREALYNAYVIGRNSVRRCAEIFNVSKTHIVTQLSKHNIQARSKRECMLGRKASQESRKKMSMAKNPRPPVVCKCLNCGNIVITKTYSKNTGPKRFCSQLCSVKFRRKNASDALEDGRGIQTMRCWELYRDFKRAVHTRDHGRCVVCGSNHKLEAHHIHPWINNADLRFDIDNGISLCHNCHKELHRVSGRKLMDMSKQHEWFASRGVCVKTNTWTRHEPDSF